MNDPRTVLVLGRGIGGVGSSDFYGEPLPGVHLRLPNPHWHVAKILHGQPWLWRQFL